jgi:hypothetical protein
MTDDDQPTIRKGRISRFHVGISVAVILALAIGFGVGYGVHSPTAAPSKKDTYTINVGDLPSGKGTYPLNVNSGQGGKGTWQHFYEYFSTNPTTTTWRLSPSTSTTALSTR